MKSLVVACQIALCGDVNGMNVTELSSKPFSKSFFKLYCERSTSSVCFERKKGWVSLLTLKEDENSGSEKAMCSSRGGRKIRNIR